MTTTQNPNEAGWFYHAPARRVNAEPVLYPPMSQVPGLSEDNGEPEEPIRPLFRDTDTKYIRLAKQGGRQNLLYMKENSSDKRDPVLYPRNEWFYLEDNRIDDEEEKKKNKIDYDFLRPEYMVHETNSSDRQTEYERPGRGPIAFDKLSAFEREPGHRATDKTVRLPELRKPGYGVRSGKPLRVPKTMVTDKKKPPTAQTDPGKGPHPLRYLPMPTSQDEEKPKMSKILSYGYERDWHNQLTNWQDKQEIGRSRHRHMTNIPGSAEGARTEYTTNFAKRSTVIHSEPRNESENNSARHSEGRSASNSVKQTETQRLREARLKKPVEKEVFKMTRFKNIPARIDTHRPPQAQQAC